MDKVTFHDKTFRPYIKNEDIEAAIDKVADRIRADFEGSGDIPSKRGIAGIIPISAFWRRERGLLFAGYMNV